MDGGDRAGYKQMSKAVDSILITPAVSPCTGDWVSFEVISTEALIKALTAPGLANSSLITTGTTYVRGALFACSKITIINLSTKNTAGKVIAHNRILL